MNEQFRHNLREILDRCFVESVGEPRDNIVDAILETKDALVAVADELRELRHAIRNHTQLIEESS